MSIIHCLNTLREAVGIGNAGPSTVAFAKAQIAQGRSLLAHRRADGRETHFISLHGLVVLAVWDAATERVVAFQPVRTDPDRLSAFVAGMWDSCQRIAMTEAPVTIDAAALAEHDALAAQARVDGGWAGQMAAAWAGAFARDNGLDIVCPFADDEPDLARRWRNAYGQGLDAVIPSADIVPLRPAWTPRPGITHAAARVALATSDKSNGIKLEAAPDGAVTLTADGENGESGVEEIAAETTAAIAVGFNAKYLTAAMDVCGDDRIALSLKSTDDGHPTMSPCIISPAGDAGIRLLIMPMLSA